jgi:predicted nucleotidyltransferase
VTVNSYLTNLANSAIIRDSEKQNIARSISTLQTRLNSYFGSQLKRQVVFGSYTRNTILPRTMDQNSDIDYMIVFADSSFTPQRYLNQLRQFSATYYGQSEIFQSNPTMVLSLNHIKLELVPAIDDWFHGLRIPAKASSYQNWIDTDPNNFNSSLTSKNQSNNSLIKPLIRLVKYWNAKNGYVFESYDLEKKVIEHTFIFVGGLLSGLLSSGQLKDYFFDFMLGLELPWGASQAKKYSLNTAKRKIEQVKYSLANGSEANAELELRKLLPSMQTSQSLLRGLSTFR